MTSPLETATDAVLGASRALVGIAARSLGPLEDEGVTLAQYRALLLVAAGRVQGPGELATALGVHPSNATRLVDRLVAKGLVERGGTGDRREVALTASASGQQLLETVLDARRAAIGEVLERLAPEDAVALADALGRFAVAAGEPADDAWRLGWAR